MTRRCASSLTGRDEFAFEFEAGGIFTEAIIRSLEQAARDQAESITLGAVNDSVSAYLSERELPQHHSSFIGDTGSQIYLLSNLNMKTESDIKGQLASELSEIETRQVEQLRAIADETKRALRKRHEHLIVSEDRVIVWSPGLSRFATLLAGICGLFVSVPMAIEAAKSAMEHGGFLPIRIILALLAAGLGLFAILSLAALLYAIRPWQGRDFVVLHTSGVIDSNGTFFVANSITAIYPSVTERNGVKETSICIRARDGSDRIILPASIYRHVNMNIYLMYAQPFVQYFRSNYDLEARSLLKHALESRYERQESIR